MLMVVEVRECSACIASFAAPVGMDVGAASAAAAAAADAAAVAVAACAEETAVGPRNPPITPKLSPLDAAWGAPG